MWFHDDVNFTVRANTDFQPIRGRHGTLRHFRDRMQRLIRSVATRPRQCGRKCLLCCWATAAGRKRPAHGQHAAAGPENSKQAPTVIQSAERGVAAPRSRLLFSPQSPSAGSDNAPCCDLSRATLRSGAGPARARCLRAGTAHGGIQHRTHRGVAAGTVSAAGTRPVR